MFEILNDIEKLDPDFPTDFCRAIAMHHGLLDQEETGQRFITQNFLMGQFQKLALINNFETCMVVYHGYDFTEEQIEALKLIHSSTRAFIKAETVSIAYKKLKGKYTTNKDITEALRYITEALVEAEENENKGKNLGGAKGGKRLIVQVTGDVKKDEGKEN